jgi:hypothetical protein
MRPDFLIPGLGGNGDGSNPIAVEVGLNKTIELPGFQYNTQTRE